jgi:hypothetical protein
MSDLPSFKNLVLSFCSASRPLEQNQRRDFGVFVEALKSFFQRRVDRFIADCRGQPLLYQYEQDGTPVTCHAATTVNYENISVTRKGKHLHDFLVEVGYLTTISPFGRLKCIVFGREPRSLALGKKWELVQGSGRFSTSHQISWFQRHRDHEGWGG